MNVILKLQWPIVGEHDAPILAYDGNRRHQKLLQPTPELAALFAGRPKIYVARDAAGTLIAGSGSIPDGFDAYIVKFRGSMDRGDIGPLEAAYADMARAAGCPPSPIPGAFQKRTWWRAPALVPAGASKAKSCRRPAKNSALTGAWT